MMVCDRTPISWMHGCRDAHPEADLEDIPMGGCYHLGHRLHERLLPGLHDLLALDDQLLFVIGGPALLPEAADVDPLRAGDEAPG